MTTPPVPSLTKPFCTVAPEATAAYDDGRQAVPWQPASTELIGTKGVAVIPLATPPRDIAIASISSMKPIAPPSLRAALRSALK